MALKIVTRKQWGAKAPKTTPLRMTRKRGYSFHWWGTHLGAMKHDRCSVVLREAQDKHMRPGGLGAKNGGNDIGYNYVICQHGYVFECRGDNIVNGANGGAPQNEEWVAVCFMFGPGDDFNALMRATGEILTIQIGGQRRDHSDFIKTECPGPDVRGWDGKGSPDLIITPPEPVKPVVHGPTTKLGANKLRKVIHAPKGDPDGYWDTGVPFDKLVNWFIQGPSPDRDGWDTWSEPYSYVNNTNGQARIVVENNNPPRDLDIVVIWEE